MLEKTRPSRQGRLKVAQHFSAGFMLEKTRPSRQGRLKVAQHFNAGFTLEKTRPSRQGRLKVARHFSAGFMLEKTGPSRQGRLKESVSARSLVDGNSIVPAGTEALRNAHPALKCWAIFITSLAGRTDLFRHKPRNKLLGLLSLDPFRMR